MSGPPGATPGEFHGRPTLRLATAHLWLEVLARGGPRVVRFGPAGGPNVFAETPDAGWDTPDGRFELLGGHRLWFAPETLGPGVPDATGLRIEPLPDGLRLTGAVEPTGLERSMDVRLDPGAPRVSIRHGVANRGADGVELAVWPITQLPLGGVALVPQASPVSDHLVVPNRVAVLWPYTSWRDERLLVADGLLGLRGRPAPHVKVGCLTEAGVAAYLRDGILFVKQFDPATDRAHADLGCNVELYCDSGSLELETLGPLVRLDPGAETSHEERWTLEAVAVADSAPDRELRSLLAPFATPEARVG